MCGIFAVQFSQGTEDVSGGRADAASVVLDGLRALEYRGYDSWGVAILDPKGTLVTKKSIAALSTGDVSSLPESRVGIGHTRWATHGGVSERNAHPHLAANGSFAVVHNGVVENFQDLKKDLITKGHHFMTETDTEVIVRLLEQILQGRAPAQLTPSMVETVFAQLHGRNTIAVLTARGELIGMRKGSPLILGRGERGAWWLSSDTLSLSDQVREYAVIEEGQGVWCTEAGTLQVFGQGTKELTFQPMPRQVEARNMGEFHHFMRKEIDEQGSMLTKPLVQKGTMVEDLVVAIRSARRVFLTGAGSADFVAHQIAYWWRRAGVAAIAVKAYEAETFVAIADEQDCCIALSQSGETADTIEAIEAFRQRGVRIGSLVNMEGATITRLSQWPCMLQIGSEIGVASTKAVTSQIIWGMGMAALLQGKDARTFQRAVQDFEQVLVEWLASKVASHDVPKLADALVRQEHLFVLGKGQCYVSALEAALKLKEIGYLHAEAFSGGELKHGVLALVESETPVLCLIAEDEERSAMLNAVAEVKARGAHVIGCASVPDDRFDTWIQLPVLTPETQQFAALLPIVAAQLLSYHVALLKGNNPDKPRHLAKSVTVK